MIGFWLYLRTNIEWRHGYVFSTITLTLAFILFGILPVTDGRSAFLVLSCGIVQGVFGAYYLRGKTSSHRTVFRTRRENVSLSLLGLALGVGTAFVMHWSFPSAF